MKYLTHAEIQLAELGVHTPQERAQMVIARAKGGDLPGGGDVRYNLGVEDSRETVFRLHTKAHRCHTVSESSTDTANGTAMGFCVSEVK